MLLKLWNGVTKWIWLLLELKKASNVECKNVYSLLNTFIFDSHKCILNEFPNTFRWCNKGHIFNFFRIGEVIIQRLNWQKIFTFPSPSEDVKVRSLSWQHDETLIAVGTSICIKFHQLIKLNPKNLFLRL